MFSTWEMSKVLNIPLDISLTSVVIVPYTISYVIRKLKQVDSFSELPKEKRPPEDLIWNGTSQELEDWINRIIYKKEQSNIEFIFDTVEG